MRRQARLRRPPAPPLTARSAVAVAALCLFLSACSGIGPSQDWAAGHSANQVFDAANQARSSLHSIDIVASRLGSATNVYEFAFGGPGQVKLNASQDGVVVGVIILGSHYYLHAPGMWQRMLGANSQTAPLIAQIDDHWVDLGGGGTQVSSVTVQLADPHFLAECLVLGPHGSLQKRGVTKVNGYSAVELDDSGDVPGSTPGRWYVATSSPHYFVRFVATGATKPGGGAPARPAKCGSTNPSGVDFGIPGTTSHAQVDFLQINRRIPISAPSGAIDIRSLVP